MLPTTKPFPAKAAGICEFKGAGGGLTYCSSEYRKAGSCQCTCHKNSYRPWKSCANEASQPERNFLSQCCAWFVNHQLDFALLLISLYTFVHICVPELRWVSKKFIHLSYPISGSKNLYYRGYSDLCLSASWLVIFTGLRAGAMEYLLMPLAEWSGISKRKSQVRFAEQAWLVVYYCIFWTLGMYIMYHSRYWFNLKELWTNFPERQMGGLLKWYYLVQFAFWLQQIIVVNIEERRKDYLQMFAHHIFTCFLMLGSYGFYQTKVGNVILCLMDVVDIILPVAKILKYLNFRVACNITFGLFIVTWFLARHVGYMTVWWSIYSDVPRLMHYGCYDTRSGQKISNDGGREILGNLLQALSDKDGGRVCFNQRIHVAFMSLLLGLQVITLVWFMMIIRVAVQVLSGANAKDSRSDDEDEDGDDEFNSEVDSNYLRLEKDPSNREADSQVDDEQIKRLTCEKSGKEKYHECACQSFKRDVTFSQEGGGWSSKSSGNFVTVGSNSSHTGTGTNANTSSSGSSKLIFRKSGSRSGGISIGGVSADRKELLGRIGCDKPT